MSGHVLPAKMSASVAAYLAVLWLLGPPRLAQSFVHVIPAMSTASTYTPKRLERTDDRPTPFLTASTSGSTIESALGSLGTVVRREMGECPHLHRGRPRCGIAVLFYSGVDTPCDGCGIQDALAGFHGCLPFVDQIIGERSFVVDRRGNVVCHVAVLEFCLARVWWLVPSRKFQASDVVLYKLVPGSLFI